MHDLQLQNNMVEAVACESDGRRKINRSDFCLQGGWRKILEPLHHVLKRQPRSA
jgi:hypothetical protein